MNNAGTKTIIFQMQYVDMFLLIGGIFFESWGYPASCTPVLKSAHWIIYSTTLLKIQSMSPDSVTMCRRILKHGNLRDIHGYPGYPIDAATD